MVGLLAVLYTLLVLGAGFFAAQYYEKRVNVFAFTSLGLGISSFVALKFFVETLIATV